MTSFEKYGFTHLSPSSLNLFAAEPALFMLKYLWKLRDVPGCAAFRGIAAESGITAGLLDPKKDPEECVALALAEYDLKTALSGDGRRAKEREAIGGIVRNGLAELRQYGELTGTQGKVVRRFEGVPIEIHGYFDYEFGAAGVIVDLKTSLRLSSEISAPHGRQLAHYVHGRNVEGRILYCCPSRLAAYRLENAAERIEELANIARRLMKMLSVSDDPAEIAAMLIPRVDEFWWSDPTMRAHAKRVYGI